MTGKTVQYLRNTLIRPQYFVGPEREIPCTLVRATVYHHDARIAGFELELRLESDAYLAVTSAGAFSLAPDNRGQALGGDLVLGQPVDLTVFLRHDLLPERFSTVDAFADEATRILADMNDPLHRLAHVDSWIFVSVMQDVPGHTFQVGFKHREYEGLDAHLLL